MSGRDWVPHRGGWCFGSFVRVYGGRDFEVAVVHVETGIYFRITAGPTRDDVVAAAHDGIDRELDRRARKLGEPDCEVTVLTKITRRMVV